MTLCLSSRCKSVIVSLALLANAAFTGSAYAQEESSLNRGLAALEEQDFVVASELFSEAFDEGDADGAFYLGRMLELGMGGTPNPGAAVGLYIAGSENGSALSMNRLGVLHVQGQAVLQDFERGAELTCAAAELNDVNGAFNCASLTLEGRGTEKDEVRAYELFKQAADLGHLGAMNEYASAMAEGRFVEQDIEGAVQLFQQTASNGNPVGLFSLGQAFAVGLGVDQDQILAHSYYNLAAALGHPQGAEARDAIAQLMSPEDIREAQQQARAWRPVPDLTSDTE